MSLFLWRIGWNAVAMDENIQSKSIAFISKCNCYAILQVETLDLLLLLSELGLKVWHFFAPLLPLEIHQDVASTIIAWMEQDI